MSYQYTPCIPVAQLQYEVFNIIRDPVFDIGVPWRSPVPAQIYGDDVGEGTATCSEGGPYIRRFTKSMNQHETFCVALRPREIVVALETK